MNVDTFVAVVLDAFGHAITRETRRVRIGDIRCA
jgi:hypothetical protein